MPHKLPPLVTAAWLQSELQDPRLVVLDASLTPVGSTATAGAPGAWPPGTRRFDIEGAFSDHTSGLPHTMPGAEAFQREARLLGVHRDSIIVVLDDVGVYSSARAWWMFRAMGHDAIAVLDGGVAAWRALGLAAAPTDSAPKPGDFVAKPRPGFFRDGDAVALALNDEQFRVLDARSKGRFDGREPEPRAGLRSGHMPGSCNIPFKAVLRDGFMRPVDELRAVFGAVVPGQRSLIMSCGSGVTACILALAAEVCGYPDISVYDGSWSEWGLPSDRPVATLP